MVDTQNITLLIPKEVLAKIKVIAARRQASVSRMLTQMLEGLVQQEDAYDHARHRHAQRLKEGVDLGTRGEVSTGREELHERV
jgi:HSP90 family molecular chaperone